MTPEGASPAGGPGRGLAPGPCNPASAMLFALLLAAAPMHVRFISSHGPVHVAIPPRPSQLTVVYVHGYWTNVDDAWRHHRLPEQLLAAQAVVIAPEAPAGPGEPVHWPQLLPLLAEVESRTGVALPAPIVAVGHSGAHRTLAGWVSEPRLRHLVLLDAFYGGASPWERFLALEPGRTLRVVARSTARRSAPFCARHPEVACEDSTLSHLGIVTSGLVLPRLMQGLLPAPGPGV